MQQGWGAPRAAPAEPPGADAALPLRERRRRELRLQLSDAATEMFLARGFDAVRVVDVARACGVTEKTVYNHFATKEALLADRWEAMTSRFAARLASEGCGSVQIALDVLSHELEDLLPAAGDLDGGAHLAKTDRFLTLVASTPALRAHEREALGHLVAVAASALADRREGGATSDPEPRDWVVACGLAGLWVVFSASLTAALERHRGSVDGAPVRSEVSADLLSAAKALERGL